MQSGSGIQELMAAETRASQIVAEARIGQSSVPEAGRGPSSGANKEQCQSRLRRAVAACVGSPCLAERPPETPLR